MSQVEQQASPRPALTYFPTDHRGASRRVCVALAWVGLAYGVVRLVMCGIYGLSQTGALLVPDVYSWSAGSGIEPALAAGSAVIHFGLLVAAILTLRFRRAGRAAMLAYGVAGIVLWAGELGNEAYCNVSGFYGDMEVAEAVWVTVYDMGASIGALAFPVLVVLLLSGEHARDVFRG